MAPLRIGIVAGEASGDILGAGLIRAIKQQYPDAEFEGVGGPLMLAEGFSSFVVMDRLSVMGIFEPLKRLPELLRIRRQLKTHFINNPPDLFLGIDSPDFNLGLELVLRKKGILTAHYVSPSVWAWRQGRIKKIAKAVDHMLTLLPFEAKFYQSHQVPVTFVGHPLADQFPMHSEKLAARDRLSLHPEGALVALMPGSRSGEINMLGHAFLDTARWCLEKRKDLHFVIPAANHERLDQLQQLLEQEGQGLPITLVEGNSQTVMTAADAILMASGTTTLEAMLIKRPMVVAYRLAYLSYLIVSRLVKAPFISLPNLLAGNSLVPEVLQDDVRADVLGPLLLQRLQSSPDQEQMLEQFKTLHQTLKQDASGRAAETLLTMIHKRREPR